MTYVVDGWLLITGIAVIAVTVPLLTWLLIDRAMARRVDVALGRLVRIGTDMPVQQFGVPVASPIPRRREPAFAENGLEPAGQP